MRGAASLVVCLVACEKARPAACPSETVVDQVSVTCCDERRHPVQLVWSVVDRIEIRTTDRGPEEEDVFWEIHDGNRMCSIPNGLIEPTHLFDRLRELPGVGYDTYAAIAHAMGSTDNARFAIWTRSKSTAE